MTTDVTVKYSNGILKLEQPVSLPENARFVLVPITADEMDSARPAVGSREAQQKFLVDCQTRPFRTGMPVTKRDELYERH